MTIWFQVGDATPTLYGRYSHKDPVTILATFESWEMAFRVFPKVKLLAQKGCS